MAMLPAFDLEGGPAVALVRGLSVAALFSVFGALLFRTVLVPPVLTRMSAGETAAFMRGWRLLIRISLAAALLATAGWLVLEAGYIADARGLFSTLRKTPTVLMDTDFGHILGLRLVALVLTALAMNRGRGGARIATGLAAVATMLQAGHSHAASMSDGPSLPLLSDIVHLLAAGAWLGGLLPLLLLIAAASPEAGALASRRFSPLGMTCVLLLAITAAFQFWVLIGGLPGLIGTGYGLVALLKMALFAVLIGLAASNRFRLTPALATGSGVVAKRALCRSIAIETGIGLLVVLAAGFLTNLPPAMHVQPLWPFAWRPSLDAVREDPEFRMEVIRAGLGAGGALALLVFAAFARRVRWPAVAAALVIGWFAVPHLGLLLVEAYPTSFYHSPTRFAATTIVAGARLFSEHCVTCHGVEGRGDGPAAKGLPIPPADLTARHLWMHSDGELFWWLSHGIDAPEGGQAMPGFASVLSEGQRWDLIDYVRAHNAGAAHRSTGRWSPPVRAPEFQARCGGRPLTLADFRGRFVRLIIGGSPAATTIPDVVTILAAPGAPPPASGDCVAEDELVARAYAIVSGFPAAELPGTQFLIDGQGWLRALQRPGQPGGWNDPRTLAAEIRELDAHPIAATADDHMDMRM